MTARLLPIAALAALTLAACGRGTLSPALPAAAPTNPGPAAAERETSSMNFASPGERLNALPGGCSSMNSTRRLPGGRVTKMLGLS